MPAVSFWGVYTFWVNIRDRNPSCVYLEAIDDFLFCLEFLGLDFVAQGVFRAWVFTCAMVESRVFLGMVLPPLIGILIMGI